VDEIDNVSRNFRHYPLAFQITESSPHPSRNGGDLRTHNGKFTQLVCVCVFRNCVYTVTNLYCLTMLDFIVDVVLFAEEDMRRR
jgi:hypothetical protein